MVFPILKKKKKTQKTTQNFRNIPLTEILKEFVWIMQWVLKEINIGTVERVEVNFVFLHATLVERY